MADSSPTLSFTLGALSFLVLLAALWMLFPLYKNPERPQRNKFVVGRVLGPPLYFVFNYQALFRYFGNPAAVDHQLRSQAVFTALWAAIGTLAILIVCDKLRSPQ